MKLPRPDRWFHHPWRRWHRPKKAWRVGNFVHFGTSDLVALGTTDGRHLKWLLDHFPHTFAFPERNLPFAEVREWMDENSADIWTMGYFHPGFADERVFIFDDDTAFAFRMRFKSIYQHPRDADEVRRALNLTMGMLSHFARTGGLKIKI